MPAVILVVVVVLLIVYLAYAVYSRVDFSQYNQDGTNPYVDALTGNPSISGFWNWIADGMPGFQSGFTLAFQDIFPWILLLLLLYFLNELRKK